MLPSSTVKSLISKGFARLWLYFAIGVRSRTLEPSISSFSPSVYLKALISSTFLHTRLSFFKPVSPLRGEISENKFSPRFTSSRSVSPARASIEAILLEKRFSVLSFFKPDSGVISLI